MSDSPSQTEKYEAFKALHEGGETFVIPNPWNAGTARILAGMGYQALATTSAGLAFSLGYLDGADCVSRDTVMQNAREIVEGDRSARSADLENGFGAKPETCAETIRLASETGLVGGSIEDATGDKDVPIYDFSHAVDRVAAAVEAAAKLPFLLTARAENFLHGRLDLDDTIRRLQAFSEAGAAVLYAPGLPDIEAIRTVCASVDKPVNVVMGLKGPTYSLKELQDAGVTRVSVGGSFARAAFGGFYAAAQEVKDNGTFTYAGQAMPGAKIASFMDSAKRT